MSSCLSISLKVITSIRYRSFKVFSFNAKLLVIVSPKRYVGLKLENSKSMIYFKILESTHKSCIAICSLVMCSLYCTQCKKNEVFQETTNLVAFTEEILNGNYQFLCNESIYSCKEQIYLNA